MIDSRGFSLIEMTVVVAISTAMMVGTTTAMLQSNRTAMMAGAKGNGQGLIREIEQTLADDAQCPKNLGGTLFSPNSAGEMPLTLNVAGRTLAKGTDLPNDGIAIKDLYLGSVRPLGMVGTHNKPMYAGDVMADIQRRDPTAAALKVQRVSRLYLEVDTGTIVTCTTKSKIPDLLSASCLQMGGTFSNGNCDMSTYANSIVTEARRQIDLDLYGPYNKMVNDQIAADLDVAMADVAARGDAATTLYTNQAIDAVKKRLTQNLNQVGAATDTLNGRIVASTTDLSNQTANAQSYATQVLQQATAAYNGALGAYGSAQAASQLANATQSNVNYTSGIAANALNYGLASQNNSAAISGVAYNAMNAAMGAVASSGNAINSANGAVSAANAANGYANNVNTWASQNVGYAQSAAGAASGAVNYANSAVGASQGAANYASSAANQASYAAGVASAAYSRANYAYNNPPQINQINTTVVTFIPRAAASWIYIGDNVCTDPRGDAGAYTFYGISGYFIAACYGVGGCSSLSPMLAYGVNDGTFPGARIGSCSSPGAAVSINVTQYGYPSPGQLCFRCQ